MGNSGCDRCLVSEIAREPDDDHFEARLPARIEKLNRRVSATIVDEEAGNSVDAVLRFRLWVEGPPECLDQRGQYFGFIVHRDHDVERN